MSYHHDYKKEKVEYHEVDLTVLKRLLKYLHSYKWYIGTALFFLLISKGIEALVPILIGHEAQNILDAKSVQGNAESVLSTAVYGLLFVIGLLFIGYLFEATNVFLRTWVGQKGLLKLRVDLFDHIQHMPLSFYDRTSVGRLISRTIHDVEQISQMFTESLVPILGSVMLFIGMFVGVVYVNWHVAVLVILFLPLIWYLTSSFRYYQRRCYEIIRAIVSAMNHFVQEHLMGHAIIRTFGLEESERRKFEEINEDNRTANLENMNNFAFFIAAIEFLQNSMLILIFVVLVLLAPTSTGFQAGTYFTFSLYAAMFFRPLSDLAERYNVLQSALASAERVFDVLDRPKEKDDEAKLILDDIQEISFEDVWFAYEDENWILRGVSFKLKKNESVALVGVTGEGKSTILSLLMRFYEIQKGAIKINHQDIRDYSLESLRKQFSLVPQDPVIFSGTIADNISLFNPEITIDRQMKAVSFVNMQNFIQVFPSGLNYKLRERGRNLSVGEMQLISLIRAVAQERTALLLDEATANIDSHTERLIQSALHKVLEHKTAIVIAHRLSTIHDVDKILVLHQGVVKETGTHQELLKLNGIYEKLYRLQFQ